MKKTFNIIIDTILLVLGVVTVVALIYNGFTSDKDQVTIKLLLVLNTVMLVRLLRK